MAGSQTYRAEIWCEARSKFCVCSPEDGMSGGFARAAHLEKLGWHRLQCEQAGCDILVALSTAYIRPPVAICSDWNVICSELLSLEKVSWVGSNTQLLSSVEPDVDRFVKYFSLTVLVSFYYTFIDTIFVLYRLKNYKYNRSNQFVIFLLEDQL